MDSSSTLFVANARTALNIALQQKMAVGAKILVPDFICDVLLHSVHQAGLIAVYYPITKGLQPDWNALETLANDAECQALIMVHYFGQPQDIDCFLAFCLRHKLILIEDNAHGYGGCVDGRLLGSFGDIGISSPRKILGTPSGGILHNADELSFMIAQRMKAFPVYRPQVLLKSVLHSMPRVRCRVRAWLDRNKDWNDPSIYRELEQPSYKIDRFSLWRFESVNWQDIAMHRRANWVSWASFARRNGLQPVFLEPHPESCPWALPVYANNLAERNRWLATREKKWRGISVFPWPSLPAEIVSKNADALAHWNTLLCFPLHTSPYR